MEVGRQQYPKGGDISEPEKVLEEEEMVPTEVRLLRVVLSSSLRPNPKLSIYDGSLKFENLLDWIT